MKSPILLALFLTTFTAFADTSIRCTSDRYGDSTNPKFDHTFVLESRPEYGDQLAKNTIELVPGITALIEARKLDQNSDVKINIVIAKSDNNSWTPYASASGKNSVIINLNSASISTRVDYSAIPQKKITESAEDYKIRVIDSLKEQEKSSLRDAMVKEYGQMASVNCAKI